MLKTGVNSFLIRQEDLLINHTDLFEVNIIKNYILGSFQGIDALFYFATKEITEK